MDPLRDAIRVSWVCVGWSLVAGVASLVVGLRSASLSLGGLGASVLIDVISSAVLIWRFRHERGAGQFPEAAERRAQIVAAVGLLGIGVVLAATGIQHLAAGDRPMASALALVLAAANLVVLPLLARWKYRVAGEVGSRALRTDAHITMVGTSTSALTLAGLGLDRAFGWWWADAGAALVIAVIAADQGRRSLSPVGEPPEETQA
ncbi:MAG TPA: cation transporter [Mycobacteriales bacterium]|nr:cation transporter [Mycobacteriales bacterium]